MDDAISEILSEYASKSSDTSPSSPKLSKSSAGYGSPRASLVLRFLGSNSSWPDLASIMRFHSSKDMKAPVLRSFPSASRSLFSILPLPLLLLSLPLPLPLLLLLLSLLPLSLIPSVLLGLLGVESATVEEEVMVTLIDSGVEKVVGAEVRHC